MFLICQTVPGASKLWRRQGRRAKGKKKMNGSETTHFIDPQTQAMKQIVSPEQLKQILDALDENHDRPELFDDSDEWVVAL